MPRITVLLLFIISSVTYHLQAQELYISAGVALNAESISDEDLEFNEGFFVEALYAKRISPKIGLGIQATVLLSQASAWTNFESYNSVELSPLLLWNPGSTKWANVETGLSFGTHISDSRPDGIDPLDNDELSNPYIGIPFRFGTTAGKFKWYVGLMYQLTDFADGGFNGVVKRPISGRLGLGFRII